MNHPPVNPMSTTIHHPQKSSSVKDPYTVIQAILTTAGILYYLNLALGFYMYGVLEVAQNFQDGERLFAFWLPAAGLLISGILLIAPAILAYTRWFGWNAPRWLEKLKYPHIGILVLLYLFTLGIGNFLAEHSFATALLLPFLHIGGVAIPILFFLALALRNVEGGSAQRKWGAFSVGLGLSPNIIIIVELVALLFFILFSIVVVGSNPELAQMLREIAKSARPSTPSPAELIEEIQPLLIKPGVVLAVLFFSSIIVPLVEEMLKPLGVWMLSGKIRTAAEGFSAGALGGAGYALLESFLLVGTRQEWIISVIGRSGTGVVHIFTAGLVGAALAEAWNQKRYARLAIAYLCSVTLHGIWNGLAILYTIRTLVTVDEGIWSIQWVNLLARATPYSIFALTLLITLAVLVFNRRLRVTSGTISTSKQELLAGEETYSEPGD